MRTLIVLLLFEDAVGHEDALEDRDESCEHKRSDIVGYIDK